MPSTLQAAPPRASTPLPGSFTLTEDASTRRFDGGTVLLGGSPLRLFRFSERARQLVERWRAGAAPGPRRPAQLLARRLVSAGAFVPHAAGGTFGIQDVTAVVPVRDRPAQLDRVLDALGGLACIVVDDASVDAGATKEIAERRGARFVGLTTNVGPGGARNAGLALVRTALVAFVDSDCVPGDGWLGPLLSHFDDPLVAAVAPRIVQAGRPRRYEAARSSLDRGERGGPVRPGSRIPFVPSAALLLRADVASGPDLFDAALRGGEDVDLVWRLSEAGWDVRYVPASTVAHDGPPTLRAFLTRRAFYGSTAGPLARRHGEALAPVHLSGWSLAVWSLLLARRPLLALAALAASVAILAHRLRGLVRDPVGIAAQIAGGGTARAVLPTLASLTRAWSPGLLLGLACRRTRAASALALLVPALRDWATDRQGLDPVRAVAVHVADDVAYGAGVWVGCARERTLVPLIPRVSWRSRLWSAPTLRNELQPAAPTVPAPTVPAPTVPPPAGRSSRTAVEER
jgi:mycofactocin glycosyltransferase